MIGRRFDCRRRTATVRMMMNQTARHFVETECYNNDLKLQVMLKIKNNKNRRSARLYSNTCWMRVDGRLQVALGGYQEGKGSSEVKAPPSVGRHWTNCHPIPECILCLSHKIINTVQYRIGVIEFYARVGLTGTTPLTIVTDSLMDLTESIKKHLPIRARTNEIHM